MSSLRSRSGGSSTWITDKRKYKSWRKVTVVLTRLGPLGSLPGALALVPALWLLHEPRAYVVLSAVMFVLILWHHRENIDRMVKRRENKW